MENVDDSLLESVVRDLAKVSEKLDSIASFLRAYAMYLKSRE